jgi:diguanylate cyclase (GGDEF)-like protein/PAS domain S-box-containing protein
MNELPEQKTERLQQLKQRAQALLKQPEIEDEQREAVSLDVAKLLEDLRIYQVELELQNEELRAAQQNAELSQRRYQSLFEQMPLPALVVEAKGVIENCNELASALLGGRKSYGSPDNRLFQGLNREDRTRLHVALRDLRHGDPLVLHKLTLTAAQDQPRVFDAHLIQLSLSYHLDNHALVLLVDRSAEVARENDQRFFSLLLDSSDNLIFAADSQGQMLLANQTLLKFIGRDEVRGQRRENFLPLHDAIRHSEADQQVLRTGEPLTFEGRAHFGEPDGTLEFLTRKFPIRDQQGQIYGVGGISTDITALKDKQRQTLLSESVFMTAAEAIIVTDPQTRIIRVNPAFTQQSSFSEASVLGHRTNILKSGRQDAAFYQAMWQSLNQDGRWSGEISNRTAEGSYYTVWSNINTVLDEQGKVLHYIAIQTDLTPLREIQSQVLQMASYDNLTGLPNRTLFNDRISQLIAFSQRRQQSFALLFIDLDHFKEVNDTLGHQVGDELLKMVAQRLQAAVRAEDTVARMGGDEFVVLLPMAERQNALQVANTLLDQLRVPMTLGQSVIYQPMASAGVAVFPDDGDTPDLLVRNADIAMYEAKLSGRNRSAAYTAQMSQDNAHAFAIQTELSAAIGRQELRVYFQPKYQLDSGALIGAEALVRWERPGHGLVPPAEFIPIAEKSGLLVAIDQWVLNEALRQVGLWQRSGQWDSAWRLAVNQTASDLRRPTMIAELQALLACHQVAPTSLELEITEDALLEHTQELIHRLRELKELGVTLAIDDFGTGYSSLSYLRKLPIAVIKIDQSFIRDMLVNDSDRILVDTIIAMAHKLGHKLVAEGVEEPAQRARLAELGCEVGQGYLFGKPVSAVQFAVIHLGENHAKNRLLAPVLDAQIAI